jgi:hypothetical protein
VLAEILGNADIREDELLLRLREAGLLAYPSPLLGGLLEYLPEVLAAEVLSRVDPTDLVMFGQVGRACRAAVVAFGVPREVETSDDDGDSEGSTGEGTEGVPLLLRVEDFVGSVERLAWAEAEGCPWGEAVCALAAGGGHLQVLKWARENRYPWDWQTCACAARGGHLEVLKWAREHGCDWNAQTCAAAARFGYLRVLIWAREHNCAWNWLTCAAASECGQTEVLQWARDHGCPEGPEAGSEDDESEDDEVENDEAENEESENDEAESESDE